jgi:hypothetical protein
MMLTRFKFGRLPAVTKSRWGIVLWLGLVMHGSSLSISQAADENASALTNRATRVEVRGRVVCLPEEMHRIHQADLPMNHGHVPGFRTDEGVYYTLLRTKLSEALFADPELAGRELILNGRVYPKTRILDVTLMRSVHDGVVHDLYYWCDICSIKSVVPGECMCCQENVVLVEKPQTEAVVPATK